MKQLTTNLKNIQATLAAQFQKDKRPNQKMGQRTKQTFLQRRRRDGQKAHENILNIIHYQRNTNQNHNDVSPYLGENDQHQKISSNKCQRGCGEETPPMLSVGM